MHLMNTFFWLAITLHGSLDYSLMNGRGHMTTNFPEYTMTHIYGYDYVPGLCKRFNALHRP